MREVIFKSLQLLFALLICACVGSPQTSLSTVQHFMLKEHIYEDRCTVSSSIISTIPTYCQESRSAYLNVYSTAGLGFALAVIPAYYAARYFGFFFTNICCCLALAAGSVVISDRPDDQWVTDRFQYGYAIVAMSAPFAIFNGLRVISTFHASHIGQLTLLVCFLSLVQLGPFAWLAFTWQLGDNELLVRELFKNLLWVPCIWLFSTLILMLLSDSTEEADPLVLIKCLKSYFSLNKNAGFEIGTFDHSLSGTLASAEPGLIALNGAYSTQGSSSFTYWNCITSRIFFALLLSYLVSSTPIDLILAGGEARSAYNEDLAIWSELTEWSPILAAIALPIVFWLTSVFGIIVISTVATTLCTLLSVLQVLSTEYAWIVSSIIVGGCQTVLIWSTTVSFITTVNASILSPVAVTFLITVALIKSLMLPSIAAAVEFDERLMGSDPNKLIIGAQILTSLYLLHTLRKEAERENRQWLELEAQAAFAADP